ncbi:uncharacterized protein [Hemitrygon akajei]|uniref:uncharacterized protein n=1 Tax=Hemitrygon akajei TaxID=2704970 RepID=UPI003BF9421F
MLSFTNSPLIEEEVPNPSHIEAGETGGIICGQAGVQQDDEGDEVGLSAHCGSGQSRPELKPPISTVSKSGSVFRAMGVVPYLCLLLSCLAGVRSDIELTQPESAVVKPGQSHTLSCAVSGFSLGKYGMYWVKQVSGKGLEWVAAIWSGGSKDYAPGVQSLFTVSKDSSIVYLQVNNPRPNDTVAYYCARYVRTTVTGIPVETKAPKIRLLPPPEGETKSGNTVTLECVASGFYPNQITITWEKGDSLISSNISVRPTALEQEGTFIASYVLTVSTEDWQEGSVFRCTVSHPPSNTSIRQDVENIQGVRSAIVLTQPESAVVQPGQSHRLTCAVSGLNLSSIWMHWVEQVPGKGLEWVAGISSEGSKYYASRVQNRFTASKDSSTIYLQINNLRLDDTATYYCVADQCFAEIIGCDGQVKLLHWVNGETEHCDSCVCWGGGTSLTVTSDVKSMPSVYITSSTSTETQQDVSLLCLVKDFESTSITSTWSTDTGEITAGIKQSPVVLGQNMKYMMSSLLRVPAADWNSNKVYTCKAGYKPDKIKQAEVQRHRTQPPEISSLVPTLKDVHSQQQAILGCLISGFYPNQIQVSWTKAGSIQMGTTLPSTMRNCSSFETINYLTVPMDQWTSGDKYTCEVTHTPSNFQKSINVTYQSELSVFIQNPDIEEMWIDKTATVKCTVICTDPEDIHISWHVGGKEKTKGIHTHQAERDGSRYRVLSELQISVEEWFSGVEYECSAQESPSSSPVTARTNSTKVEIKSPKVRLLPPPQEETKERQMATLECVASGFFPDQINVIWEKGSTVITSNTSATPTALEQGWTFSARHFLTMSLQEWETESVFSCTVIHPPSNSSIKKQVKNIQDECSATHPSVTLSKPSFEEIWTKRTATILCEVVHSDLQGFSVTWQVDGRKREDGVWTLGPDSNGGEDMITSRLTVPAAEWNSGAEYSCVIKDESLPTPVKKSIRKNTVDVVIHPQVYLLPPSSDEVDTDQTGTLMCLVTKFSPTDIYVAWMANDTLLKTGFVNQPVTKDPRRGWNTMTSQLKVTPEEWKSGTTFSCVVGHESLTTNLFRSINKSHSKPTLVNVSLVLTDSFKSCV